jgi:hypothetical protein
VELDCQALENYFDILTMPLCKREVLKPHRDHSTNLMMLNCPMVHSGSIYLHTVVELAYTIITGFIFIVCSTQWYLKNL